ncbi:uncharacterized protein LAJ45_09750 [Morchella importuna]|uniref:uncharacterized protein n=1 Tax=Morchella importuna TaxID=1174673 RepID=UPI001E8CA7BA|nr:uncharacterized protein LAJ45_09750 [Morchella importuna]KAH8146307.1 hypothetical protein LAJ45_09750 [Morchella importuna]
MEVHTYEVLAYFMPASPPNVIPTLTSVIITLTSSNWFVTMDPAIPDGVPTDIYQLPSAPPTIRPCYCGNRMQSSDESEGEWDSYWECTAVCKLWKRFKIQQEIANGPRVEFYLFVETELDLDETPLLERVDIPDVPPIWERRMLMIRVERTTPVDVRPDQNDLGYIKRFLKTRCHDETQWIGRFSNDDDLDGYEAWEAGDHTDYDFIEPDEGELGDDEYDESDSDNDEYDDASEGYDSDGDDDYDEKDERYGADETETENTDDEEEYFNEKETSEQEDAEDEKKDEDTDDDEYEGKYWGLHIERESKIAKPWMNEPLKM